MSFRMEAVSESGTVKMADTVKALRAKGVDVVSFSIGEPDFPTPDHIVQAGIDALRSGFTKYTPSAGIPELREAVASKLQKENGITADPSEIIVTPTKQAIFMSVLALVDRADEVILPDPAWVSYEPIVRIAEAVPVPVRADEETGFRLNPDHIAEKVTDKTRMIMLNSPSNPTGSVASEEEVRAICEIATDRDLLLLSDEIYEHIIYDAANHSPASFPGMKDRVITVNGFSKTYSMTGWRLGYLHASAKLLEDIQKVQTHSITCATSFAQKAGVAALNGPLEPVERMVTEFRKRRDLTVKKLREMPGVSVVEPKGAFYVFPRYDFDMSSVDMAQYLLDSAHVAVTPGSAFGEHGERHLRISYATGTENLERGLDAMSDALSKL